MSTYAGNQINYVAYNPDNNTSTMKTTNNDTLTLTALPQDDAGIKTNELLKIPNPSE